MSALLPMGVRPCTIPTRPYTIHTAPARPLTCPVPVNFSPHHPVVAPSRRYTTLTSPVNEEVESLKRSIEQMNIAGKNDSDSNSDSDSDTIWSRAGDMAIQTAGLIVGVVIGNVIASLFRERKETVESLDRLITWGSLQKESTQNRLIQALKKTPDLFTPEQLVELVTFVTYIQSPMRSELMQLVVLELTKNSNEKIWLLGDISLSTLVEITKNSCDIVENQPDTTLYRPIYELASRIDRALVKEDLLDNIAEDKIKMLIDIFEVFTKIEFSAPHVNEAVKKLGESLAESKSLSRCNVELSRLITACVTAGCDPKCIAILEKERKWLETSPPITQFFNDARLTVLTKQLAKEILTYSGPAAVAQEGAGYLEKYEQTGETIYKIYATERELASSIPKFSSAEEERLTAALQSELFTLLKKEIDEDPKWHLHGIACERLVDYHPQGILRQATITSGVELGLLNLPSKLTIVMKPVISLKDAHLLLKIYSSIGDQELRLPIPK